MLGYNKRILKLNSFFNYAPLAEEIADEMDVASPVGDLRNLTQQKNRVEYAVTADEI